MIQLLFIRHVFLLISHKAGKAKWIEKRSVRSRPVKQVFLQYIYNQLYTCAIYIFSRYLNSTLCSWIIEPNRLVVPLTDAAPQFPQRLNPFIHALLITMPAAGARQKATKIYLINCAWSRNLPKTQHTSYTHTLTILKYFSSASHNIILSLSYDLISYTLFLLFLHFFFIILRFSVYRVHVPYKAVFFLICVLCLKEI